MNSKEIVERLRHGKFSDRVHVIWEDTPEAAADEIERLEAQVVTLRAALETAQRAIVHTREYVGESLLPEVPGWSWYDAMEELDAALKGTEGA